MKKAFQNRELVIFGIILILLLGIGFMPKKTSSIENAKLNFIENPHEVRDQSDVLKIGLPPKEKSLNPFYEDKTSLVTKLIHLPLYERLEDGSMSPVIANSFWLEEEGRTLAVLLNKGVYFASGREMKAKDLADNIKILADPSYSGPKFSYVEGLRGYYEYKKQSDPDGLGIEVLGDYFIKLHFNQAAKEYYQILELPVLDLESIPYRYGNVAKIADVDFLDGTGAYQLSHQEDKQFFLKLKDNKGPGLEEIELNFLPFYEAKTTYASGSLDILYKYDMDFDRVDGLVDRAKDYTYTIYNQANDYLYVGFDVQEGLFTESTWRQALRNSIDFTLLIDKEKRKPISYPMYENSLLYNQGIRAEQDIFLKDVLWQLPRKQLRMGIHENLVDIPAIKAKLIEAFSNEGLDLEIISLTDAQMWRVLSGLDHYDLFLASDKLFMIPLAKNQRIEDEKSQAILQTIEDIEAYERLKWIEKIYGYENYAFAAHHWQAWFFDAVPYIPVASNLEVSYVNKRLEGLKINEFVGLEAKDNLDRIKSQISPLN